MRMPEDETEQFEHVENHSAVKSIYVNIWALRLQAFLKCILKVNGMYYIGKTDGVQQAKWMDRMHGFLMTTRRITYKEYSWSGPELDPQRVSFDIRRNEGKRRYPSDARLNAPKPEGAQKHPCRNRMGN